MVITNEKYERKKQVLNNIGEDLSTARKNFDYRMKELKRLGKEIH